MKNVHTQIDQKVNSYGKIENSNNFSFLISITKSTIRI